MKKSYWYKVELIDPDTAETVYLYTGLISVPFYWTPMMVYKGIKRDYEKEPKEGGQTWMITDFRRV
jgi:hypothetical protein